MACIYYDMSVTQKQGTNSLVTSILTKTILVGVLLIISAMTILVIGCMFNPAWLVDGLVAIFPFIMLGLVLIAFTEKILEVIKK